ncbi:sulfite exporter TauE/SafE family protein [Terrarubrum flagellatum]|uniref:sulfite exporter TauE/SafE family protein n=1 Tax=Terrirubrum flagellatum TaxID=2895980 RepID=UPI003144E589
MDFHLLPLIAVAAIFILAGFVKGMIGLGLPTIAIGLLSLFMPPAQAASLLIAPSLITNLWQLSGPRLLELSRRLWPMLTGVCVGAWLGGGILTGANAGRAVMALGVALIVYALVGLSAIKLSVPRNAEVWAAPLVGIATGFITAATGVFVLPAVPYLQAIGLDKDDLIQALGLSFTVSTIALGAGLLHDGAFETRAALASIAVLIPTFIGMYAGQFARERVSPATFRRWFFLGLLALGFYLAARAVS